MTTNILILAYDWPVKVEAVDHDMDGKEVYRNEAIVPPHKHATHYVTSSRSLVITEMPVPAAATNEESEVARAMSGPSSPHE